MRVAIVGGGVIGLSLAWELARRGHQPTVIEKALLGRAASWAGAGILPPSNLDTAIHPMEHLEGRSDVLHPQWADRLKKETGIDTGFPTLRRAVHRQNVWRKSQPERSNKRMGSAQDRNPTARPRSVAKRFRWLARVSHPRRDGVVGAR